MPTDLARPAGKIRVGVSSCLLGQRVRHDGGHKFDATVAGLLAGCFELVPVCPEVEAGMGVPREPVRLVRGGGEVRMLGLSSGKDHSEAMRGFASRRAAELTALGLGGYILKKNSPSCGVTGVPTCTDDGAAAAPDRGLFVAALVEALPGLPLIEEDKLVDAALRENFIAEVRAYSASSGKSG